MKIKITSEFIDKTDKRRTFTVGEVVDFDNERGGMIIKRGLGVSADSSATEDAPITMECKVIEKRKGHTKRKEE